MSRHLHIPLLAMLSVAAIAALSAPEPSRATVAGVRSVIAYSSDRTGQSQIYSQYVDSAGFTRLTNDAAADRSPAFSPNGAKIAFQSDRDGQNEIYVMSADGSNQVRLTNDPASDTSPAWSPDGTHIAFVSDRAGDRNIYLMTASGTGVTQLTSDPGIDDNPTFSPDGSTIAFDSDRTGHAQIFVMPLANPAAQTNLSANDRFESNPTYSPDGLTIAFVGGADPWGGELWTMAAGGTHRSQIDAGISGLGDPAFAPDGSQVAASFPGGGGHTIVLIALNGTYTALTDNHENVSPDWQPATSALSMRARPATPYIGQPVTVSGVVQLFRGTAAGQTISLWATPPEGAPTHLGDAVTGADGAYSFTVVPNVTGIWTLEARFAGDATHDPIARVATLSVRIRTTALTIALSRNPASYGQSVLATAHLADHHTNSVVTIYRQVRGHEATVLRRGSVGRRGNISVLFRPARTALVWASWTGDDWYKSAASPVKTMRVRVVVGAAMAGGYGSSGVYRLYHYNPSCATTHAGCPAVAFAVRPNHAGKKVLLQLFVLRSGHWTEISQVAPPLNARSAGKAIVIYRGSAVIGHRFRVHVGYLGDADHLGNGAPYRYFRITA